MIARLWWKDARQFWPIWVLLAVIGLATQGLALHYVGRSARSGELAVPALGWTCLYAFAVAAAAFAGERENRTLHLLDALPVERWTLWKGKVSFAFVSTLGLGLFLFLAAALVTDEWQVVRPPWGVLEGVAVLVAVLGCSCFWSAIMSNALLAAVLAVFTSLLLVPAFDAGLNLKQYRANEPLYQLFYGVVSLAASGWLFVRLGPPQRPLVRRRVRPRTTRPAAAPVAVTPEVHREPRFWPSAMRSLAWQTGREVRPIWWRLALLCLVVPPCFYIGQRAPFEAWGLCILIANIVAGVCVFGIENRARSQVFLANEGVRPGLVWSVKTSIWLAAMAPLWYLAALLAAVFGGSVLRIPTPTGLVNLADALFLIGGVPLITFAIPIFCGMVIRRGITAATVAVLVLMLVTFPLLGLFAMRMLPSVFLLLVALAFLAVSFGWSRDWMMDRPEARRWVKLAVLLGGCFGALFASYIAVRVEGVPTLDPVREAQIFQFTTPTSASAANNAADLYRSAAQVANTKALELVRKAATMPACQFWPLDKLTVFSSDDNASSDLIAFNSIPRLLATSILDHQARGDLDGVWADLEVMFRIARQWSGAVPLNQALAGLNCERDALSRAMVWAAEPKQTPERLRSALEAYRKLPPMPDPADPIRAEAQIIRNTEKLPRSELVEKIFDMRVRGSGRSDMWMHKLWADLVATPWELARTSRAFRLLYASKIQEARVDPWYTGRVARWGGEAYFERLILDSPAQVLAPATLLEIEATTPLVQTFLPAIDRYLQFQDYNLVERRALVQILALRIWQLRHDGRLPDKLQELVTSGLLDDLPADPYTPGHPFGYVRSSGQALLPLGELGPIWMGSEELKRLRPTPGSWLLYSVGRDTQDDGARTNESQTGSGDLVFPLAESKTGGQGGSPH